MPCAARTSANTRPDGQGGKGIGRILRNRLGRRPPRHRPGGPRRQAAGPPAGQRRRGRPGPAAGTARRARRQRRTTRSRWRSRLRAGCSWPACAPPAAAVYPVNPMAVARYRDRHSVAGRKSDKGDAAVLANVLRTDLHAHRPLPADSELAQAVAVLARAQQDAVWDRTQRAQQAPLPPARVLPRLPAPRSPPPAAASCAPRPASSWPPPPPRPTRRS